MRADGQAEQDDRSLRARAQRIERRKSVSRLADLIPGFFQSPAQRLTDRPIVMVSVRSLAAGGAELRVRQSGQTRTVPLAAVDVGAREILAGV